MRRWWQIRPLLACLLVVLAFPLTGLNRGRCGPEPVEVICVPSPEICDGIDNDCNGLIDDGLPDVATVCGEGPTASTGVLTCVDGEWVDTCEPAATDPGGGSIVGPGDPELNCPHELVIVSDDQTLANGAPAVATYDANPRWTASIEGATWIWESFLEEQPEEDNEVIFVRTFHLPSSALGLVGDVTIASDNSYICDLNGGTAFESPHEFNYFDENVETYELQGQLVAGENTFTCAVLNWAQPGSDGYVNPGGLLYRMEIFYSTPLTPEVCDGFDNNCNGLVDDGLAETPTSCGVGACASTGVLSCVDGEWHDCCVPGEPSPEICDGTDNDCNGLVDDGLAETPTTCGVGACASTGVLSCVDGEWHDCCVPGEPSPEICDGLDNDCNGIVDDGFSVGGACLIDPCDYGYGVTEVFHPCIELGYIGCSPDGDAVCIGTGCRFKTVWQLGVFDLAVDPQDGSLEFPANGDYTASFIYEVVGDGSPAPELPGYLSDVAMSEIDPGRRQIDATGELIIRFALAEDLEGGRLQWSRYGSEVNGLYLNGAFLTSNAGAEGVNATYDIELPLLEAGVHEFVFLYEGGGVENGNYLDALRLVGLDCGDLGSEICGNGIDDDCDCALLEADADISGRVWHDADRDGAFDFETEEPFAGVTVQLFFDSNDDGDFDTLLGETETDAQGLYQFAPLCAGSYLIQIDEETLPPLALIPWDGEFQQWVLLDPTNPAELGLASEQEAVVDFGYFWAHSQISLYKFAPESAFPGETITYEFMVYNCGNLAITGGFIVYDEMLNPTGDHVILEHGALEPGEAYQFSLQYQIPVDTAAIELCNTAMVVGVPELGLSPAWDVGFACTFIEEPVVVEPCEGQPGVPTGKVLQSHYTYCGQGVIWQRNACVAVDTPLRILIRSEVQGRGYLTHCPSGISNCRRVYGEDCWRSSVPRNCQCQAEESLCLLVDGVVKACSEDWNGDQDPSGCTPATGTSSHTFTLPAGTHQLQLVPLAWLTTGGHCPNPESFLTDWVEIEIL